MPLVELHNFPDDLVTDSPHLGRPRSAPIPKETQGIVELLRSVLLKL
jgi:hypothetical protein